jgi:hypothetical protein
VCGSVCLCSVHVQCACAVYMCGVHVRLPWGVQPKGPADLGRGYRCGSRNDAPACTAIHCGLRPSRQCRLALFASTRMCCDLGNAQWDNSIATWGGKVTGTALRAGRGSWLVDTSIQHSNVQHKTPQRSNLRYMWAQASTYVRASVHGAASGSSASSEG